MKKLIGFLVSLTFLFSTSAIAKEPKYYSGITLNPERTIILQGEVTENKIHSLINKMLFIERENNKLPIFVIIDSPGGYVDAGWKFINALQALKVTTVGIISSKAYSMAAIISLYFDILYMVDSSDIMLHEAAFVVAGSETIVKSRFEASINYLEKMHINIAKKLNLSLDIYKEKIRKEWWILPEEAMLINICDGILKSLKYEILIEPEFSIFQEIAPFDIYMGVRPPKTSIRIGN